MKVELKNVKVARSLSEETTAFTATLYVDGVAAADVRNIGQGGCNDYYPKNGKDGLLKSAEAEAARLHPGDYEGLDSLVSDLLQKVEDERAIKRFKNASAKKGFDFAAVAEVLEYTIKGYEGKDRDGNPISMPATEVTALAMSAFRSEEKADEWVATGAAKEHGDKFRSARRV